MEIGFINMQTSDFVASIIIPIIFESLIGCDQMIYAFWIN